MASTHRIALTPAQMAFLKSPAPWKLADGGFGSGKTFTLGTWVAWKAASDRRARVILARKHLVSLKSTTLKTLLFGDGDMPPILPPGSYVHNKSEKFIRIKGGGEIIYFGMDDPLKRGSVNASDAALDEVVEFTTDDLTWIRGRLRVLSQEPGYVNQIAMVCNPDSPSHHVAERFGITDGETIRDGHARYQIHPWDNPGVGESYIGELDRLTGVHRARYFEGKWVGAEGLVYPAWKRTTHVRRVDESELSPACVGVDDGVENPFVMLDVRRTPGGMLHVHREYRDQHMPLHRKVERLRSWGGLAVADDAAAQLIQDAKRAGLSIRAAGKGNVVDGIQVVAQALECDERGNPGLTVDPSCKDLIREFESYAWKQDKTTGKPKDEPVKKDDHGMDALRYALVFLNKPRVAPTVIGKRHRDWNDFRGRTS